MPGIPWIPGQARDDIDGWVEKNSIAAATPAGELQAHRLAPGRDTSQD